MLIEKTVNFSAPVEKVWEKMESMENVIKCMPGVEEIEDCGNGKWRVVIKQKVGFISATFDADIEVVDSRPPTHMETTADVTLRRGLGKVFQKQRIELIAVSENETTAKYSSELNLSGTIGTFGHRVLSGKADQLADQFTESFSTMLNEDL